ncbi:MAG: glycosyltransferase family 9 protein [Elusimicrobiaceae bacterium]|nr:glycosyltransferase family 9 protein [Elusimicrobiaceae bacterium]
MTFREWNRKKNLWLRAKKAQLAKFLFDRKTKEHYLPSAFKSIKKVLFLRYDNKLGDMIVSTISFHNLKALYPKIHLSVITGQNAAKIIENNKDVDQIYIYKRNWLKILKLGLLLRKEKYDLVIDIDRETTAQSIFLLRLIKARFIFGFNRNGYKLYNINRPYTWNSAHITKLHKAVFEGLKILPRDYAFDYRYILPLPKESVKLAEKIIKPLKKEGQKVIIFNPFAASHRRCFSAAQALEIANLLPKYKILVIGPAGNLKTFFKGHNALPANLALVSQENALKGGILLNIALLKQADILISPDTYIVHAASGFEKKQICVYLSSDQENITLWGPNSQNAVLLENRHIYNKDFNLKELVKELL